MIKEYLDFELHFSVVGKSLHVDLVTRPTAISLAAPIKVATLKKFKKFDQFERSSIDSYGKKLFDAVFSGEVREKFEAFLARRQEAEGIRVCVEMLATVPLKSVWEAICQALKPDVRFLVLDPKTPVIRIPRPQREVYLRSLELPLSILVVLAAPDRLEPIDGAIAKQVLTAAILGKDNKSRIKLEFLGFGNPREANYATLKARVASRQYDVVHIIGHGLLEKGEEGKIALVDPETGKEQLVDASELALVFTSRSTMLVVLQSCYGGDVDPSTPSHSGLAEKLVAFGVPAVLALRQKVDQDVANCFMQSLYGQWTQTPCLLEDALTQARQNVYQQFKKSLGCWVVPVLYRHPAVKLAVAEKVEAVTSPTRVLDAALPEETRVARHTDLVILLRAPGRPGLREILQSQPRDYEVTPEEVRTSPTFDANFPKDETSGELRPMDVLVRATSNDFQIPIPETKLAIRPDGDGVIYNFAVTPIREGRAKITVTVVDAKDRARTLAQMILRSTARIGDTFETNLRVLDREQADVEQRYLDARASQLHASLEGTRTSLSYSMARTREFGARLGELEPWLDYDEKREINERVHALRALLDGLKIALTQRGETEPLHWLSALADEFNSKLETGNISLEGMRRWELEVGWFLHRLGLTIGEDTLAEVLGIVHERAPVYYEQQIRLNRMMLHALENALGELGFEHERDLLAQLAHEWQRAERGPNAKEWRRWRERYHQLLRGFDENRFEQAILRAGELVGLRCRKCGFMVAYDLLPLFGWWWPWPSFHGYFWPGDCPNCGERLGWFERPSEQFVLHRDFKLLLNLSQNQAQRLQNDVHLLRERLSEIDNTLANIKPYDVHFLREQLRNLEKQYHLVCEIIEVAEKIIGDNADDSSAYKYLRDRLRNFLKLLH